MRGLVLAPASRPRAAYALCQRKEPDLLSENDSVPLFSCGLIFLYILKQNVPWFGGRLAGGLDNFRSKLKYILKWDLTSLQPQRKDLL